MSELKKELESLLEKFGGKDELRITFGKEDYFTKKLGDKPSDEDWISASGFLYDADKKGDIKIQNVNFNGRNADLFNTAYQAGIKEFVVAGKFGSIKETKKDDGKIYYNLPFNVKEIKSFSEGIKADAEIIKYDEKKGYHGYFVKLSDGSHIAVMDKIGGNQFQVGDNIKLEGSKVTTLGSESQKGNVVVFTRAIEKKKP